MGLLKRSLYIATGKIFQAITTFTYTIILSRLLSKFNYGIYQQSLLTARIIIAIMTFGIPVAIFYFLPRFESENRDKFISTTIFLAFISSLLAILLTYLASLNSSILYHNTEITSYLILFSIFIAGRIFSSILDPFLISKHRENYVMYYYSFFNLIELIFIILFYRFSYSFKSIFLFFALIGIAQTFTTFLLIRFIYRLKLFTFDFKIFKRVISYSHPIAINSILGILSSNLDKIIISGFLGATYYAIYINGSYQIPLLAIFISSVVAVIAPDITSLHYQKENVRLISIIRKSIDKTSMLVLPLFLFFLITSKEFILTLYSDKFYASIAIFRITLFILPFRLTNYGNILNLLGKTKTVLYISLIELILNGALSVTLLHFMGIYGPAVSFLATTILQIAVLIYFIVKTIGTNISALFPVNNMVSYFLIAILSSIPLFILKLKFSGLQLLIMETAVFSAVFMILYLIWRRIFEQY